MKAIWTFSLESLAGQITLVWQSLLGLSYVTLGLKNGAANCWKSLPQQT